MATAHDYLAAAASELGYLEQPAGSNRTKFAAEAGHANGQPWCATFVVAIAKRVGVALPSTSAYTPTMANGFRAAKQWHDQPAAGDVVFFDFPDSVHRIQHVGIVEAVNPDGSLVTIEGNTASGTTGSQDNGGGVWRRKRARGLAVGYGRPTLDPQPSPSPTPSPRRPAVVRNHVRTIVAPNGGYWHLQADGGVVTADDGNGSPEAPFWGSVPGIGGLPVGSIAVDLVAYRSGYAVIAHHAGDIVSAYHFPGRTP